MLHLLLITLVPFTMMLIGRYPTLAPAVWFYAGNTIAFALVALRMVTLSEYRPSEERMIEDRIELGMLIAASVTVILISFIEPKWALLGFLLNALDEPLLAAPQEKNRRLIENKKPGFARLFHDGLLDRYFIVIARPLRSIFAISPT